MMHPKVDQYLLDGCGRCPLGGTPACKVNDWREPLTLLRSIVLECGLTEERKWGVPCYTYEGKNVLILAAFKDYCAINFFKGALLRDAEGILTQQTENVQAGRQIRFTTSESVAQRVYVLKKYVLEAVDIEKTGQSIAYKDTSAFAVPEELTRKMAEMPEFKTAFEALTPGRQRGYLLHFAQPKQAKTREARVEKCVAAIMAGKGLHD